jgi:tetratricopeptide (TPR) repeat protein
LGEIALTEKRPLDAVREFAESDSLPDGPDGDCYFCKQVLIARAYERAGVVDSAIVNYERYLAGRFAARLSLDAQYAPYVHEHLGALYEAKGNTERAARHYATFVDLWKNADPALQPRVAAARQRLARLNQVASR